MRKVKEVTSQNTRLYHFDEAKNGLQGEVEKTSTDFYIIRFFPGAKELALRFKPGQLELLKKAIIMAMDQSKPETILFRESKESRS